MAQIPRTLPCLRHPDTCHGKLQAAEFEKHKLCATRYGLWALPFRVAHAGLKPGATLVPIERLIGEVVSLAILFAGNVGN